MKLLKNLFFSAHFGKADIVCAAFVFILTMLLSTIITHETQIARNGEPFLLHGGIAASAITQYKTGEIRHCNPGKDAATTSRINDFLFRGKQDLSNQDLKDLSGHNFVSLFGSLYSINTLVSSWWHFIGFPSKTYFSLCLGVVFGLMSIITYFLLRICGGALSSLFLTLLIQCSVTQLSMLYVFRDWSRVIPILPILFLIVWITRNGLSWKRAVWGGILAGLAIGFGRGFRTDYYFYLPFLAGAVCFFPKLKSNWWKKVAFLSITAALATTVILHYRSKMPPNAGQDEPGLAIVYIGLAPDLLDKIVTSPRQYTWSPACVDEVFSVAPWAIAEFRKEGGKDYTTKEAYTRDIYDRAIFNELMRIGWLFPYDFSIIAFSSTINILQHSVGDANANFKSGGFIRHTTPAYSMIRLFSEDILRHIPGPVCVGVVIAALLLLGLFSCRKCIFYIVMGLIVMGICAAQWQARHFFYAFIYVLMAANLIIYIVLRILIDLVRFRRRAFKTFFMTPRRYKRVGRRFLTILSFFLTVAVFIFICYLFQSYTLQSKAKELALAEKRVVNAVPVSEDLASKEDGPATVIKTGHIFTKKWTHYDIPELNRQYFIPLLKGMPVSHCEFLTLKFRFPENVSKHRLGVILRYQSDRPNGKWRPGIPIARVENGKKTLIRSFSFYSQWVEGPFVHPGELYFITPIYYYHSDKNGFQGFSIPEEFVPYLQEVAILKDRKIAPCNWQFYLSPDSFDRYPCHQYLTLDNLINNDKR